MAIGATNYPATLDTPTELIRVANVAGSTIGVGGVTNVATTVPVTDTTTFPNDGVVWCGTEAISYTAKTGTTLTGCVRGFDGTTAAAHAALDPIYGDIITSAHHEALRDAIIALETTLGATNGTIPARTLTTPTITDFSNAQHAHSSAAAGGLVPSTSVTGLAETFLTASTFSAAAACSFNGIFTAAYDNYLLIGQLDASSTAQDVIARMRAAGVDASTAVYAYTYHYGASNATTGGTGATAASNGLAHLSLGATLARGGFALRVYRPQKAIATVMESDCVALRNDGILVGGSCSSVHNAATAYDGITIFPSAGTFTGTIRAYAYRDS